LNDARADSGLSSVLPRIIGHRGAAGAAPENTLAALRKARELGAEWVEFDVRLTRDGRVILLHDDRLERTTDGRGAAIALTLSEIRLFDAGAWFSSAFRGERVPTLEEAIEVLEELDLGANIELKPAAGTEIATARAVAGILARQWPRRLPPPLLSSFSAPALGAMRNAASESPLGYLVWRLPRYWQRDATALGCATIHCNYRYLDAPRIRAVRRAGFPLLAYTVNDPRVGNELFEWGVNGLFTDRPELFGPEAQVCPRPGDRDGPIDMDSRDKDAHI
jgi:glycerophosphoryl diester phosphodiesterase